MDINILFKKFMQDPEFAQAFNEPLEEDLKSEQFKLLKESLGSDKYNKIQSLIKECLKEGMGVEITIPKKKLLKESTENPNILKDSIIKQAKIKNKRLSSKSEIIDFVFECDEEGLDDNGYPLIRFPKNIEKTIEKDGKPETEEYYLNKLLTPDVIENIIDKTTK